MNKIVIISAVAIAAAIGIAIGIIGSGITTNQNSNITESNTSNEIKPSLEKLSGSIVIDGSSTVYPITEKIAEEFSKRYPDVKVSVGISGTGGGFKRFTIGETDINDSSRSITEKEINQANENNIKWIEIPIAIEGLAIVVNKENEFIDCISIAQLREIWKPDSNINNWSDIDARYPNEKITLYGAGPDSGTFDYFTERVVGKARESRTDYIPSEDDNVLVLGVSRDRYALGYIPEAYAVHATDKLKVLKVAGEDGQCVEASDETIIGGRYPLSRPLFIHVNYDKLNSKEELKRFVEFYVERVKDVAKDVGYQPLPDDYYTKALSLLKEGRYTANDKETFNKVYKGS